VQEMFRNLVEQLSRNIILKRYLPARFGRLPIFVSPDARLSFWRHDLEKSDEGLFVVAEEFVKPGDIIWDIGANVGLFSFASAVLAGSKGYVLSVEADNWLVEILQRTDNLKTDHRAKVNVLHAAVDHAIHIAQFNIAKHGRASNCLEGYGSTQTGGIRESHLVVAVTLDWILNYFPQPKLIKIDVEGAEVRVLEGGLKVLSEVKPIILCEVSHLNGQTVFSLLHSYGYTIFDMDVEKQKRQPIVTFAPNIIAIPQK
jgi:FkbM family methyltransferase